MRELPTSKVVPSWMKRPPPFEPEMLAAMVVPVTVSVVFEIAWMPPPYG
jgi:hypothetical protein